MERTFWENRIYRINELTFRRVPLTVTSILSRQPFSPMPVLGQSIRKYTAFGSDCHIAVM